MKRSTQFLLVLILGLAGLTLGASRIVDATTRQWFERDLGLRAQLAVTSARSALLGALRGKDVTALIEYKGMSVALHYRRAIDRAFARSAIWDAIRTLSGTRAIAGMTW